MALDTNDRSPLPRAACAVPRASTGRAFAASNGLVLRSSTGQARAASTCLVRNAAPKYRGQDTGHSNKGNRSAAARSNRDETARFASVQRYSLKAMVDHVTGSARYGGISLREYSRSSTASSSSPACAVIAVCDQRCLPHAHAQASHGARLYACARRGWRVRRTRWGRCRHCDAASVARAHCAHNSRESQPAVSSSPPTGATAPSGL